jgi:transposase-like protein
MSEIICTRCDSTHCKKNGHIHNGKQNHRCKDCGRQFVMDNAQKIIPDPWYYKTLLECLSLRGTCRTFSVSLTWLLSYIVEVYEHLPADLNVKPVK